MGKLAEMMARKRDLPSDYEHELRSVRDLVLGISSISGAEYTIDLAATEGFVAGSAARAGFLDALHSAMHGVLVQYARDLAREGLDHGMDPDIVGRALGGAQEPTADIPGDDELKPAIPLAACA